MQLNHITDTNITFTRCLQHLSSLRIRSMHTRRTNFQVALTSRLIISDFECVYTLLYVSTRHTHSVNASCSYEVHEDIHTNGS